MLLAFKIEVKGTVDKVGGEIISTYTNRVDDKAIRDVLGKVLYHIETRGYDFKTSEVYDIAIANFEKLTLRRQYRAVYESDNVKVSIKYA